MIRPDDLTPEERRTDAINDAEEPPARACVQVPVESAKAILAEYDLLRRDTVAKGALGGLAVIALCGEQALILLRTSLREQGLS